MQINWFTFAAQIVNFLVLIWLLKRFLYGPIISAMDRREETIRSRLESAEEKEREARRQSEQLAAERQALEEERERLLAEARDEVEHRKKEWMAEARQEVEQQEQRWRETVRQQQSSFLQELRDRSGRQLIAAAEQIIDDLSGESLEEQVLETFIDRLQSLDAEGRSALRTGLRSETNAAPIIFSSFEIPEFARSRISELLREQVDTNLQPRFRVESGMPLGIELKAGGWKLAWSVHSYLTAVEDELRRLFETERRKPLESDGESRQEEVAE